MYKLHQNTPDKCPQCQNVKDEYSENELIKCNGFTEKATLILSITKPNFTFTNSPSIEIGGVIAYEENNQIIIPPFAINLKDFCNMKYEIKNNNILEGDSIDLMCAFTSKKSVDFNYSTNTTSTLDKLLSVYCMFERILVESTKKMFLIRNVSSNLNGIILAVDSSCLTCYLDNIGQLEYLFGYLLENITDLKLKVKSNGFRDKEEVLDELGGNLKICDGLMKEYKEDGEVGCYRKLCQVFSDVLGNISVVESLCDD